MDPSLEPLASIVASTPVATIDEVVAVLTALAAALPAGDGIAAFARLYREVTLSVQGAVAARSFNDAAWLGRLDVVFANLFFRAVTSFCQGSEQTPRAWFPLFSRRSDATVTPLQFAFAGVNAHINRDLPVALCAVCAEMNLPLAASTPEHGDYVAVNAILASVEDRVKSEFIAGAVAAVDRVAGKLDDRIASFSLVEARAAAWSHGETLWALRGLPSVSAAFLDSLDGLVGFAGRGLLLSI